MRGQVMDHYSSMATTTNNGDGSKDHLSSSLQDGRPYRQTFSYSENSGQQHRGNLNMFPVVFPVVAVIILLFRFLYHHCRITDAEKPEAGAGDGVGQGVDVEMAPPVQTAEPPLVCTYRKADGWREGSCGVCLAELDDGEAVRVLPACMHYFHAACVGEWLHARATCPLCRAPLVVAPDDAAT